MSEFLSSWSKYAPKHWIVLVEEYKIVPNTFLLRVYVDTRLTDYTCDKGTGKYKNIPDPVVLLEWELAAEVVETLSTQSLVEALETQLQNDLETNNCEGLEFRRRYDKARRCNRLRQRRI